MTAAPHIALGQGRQAAPPLLLAPEIWGEPVVERAGKETELGAIRWALLDRREPPAESAGSPTEDDLDELVGLSPCFELAPTPSGWDAPYPHDARRRWTWAHASMLAALSATAAFAVTLSAFALLGAGEDALAADGAKRTAATAGLLPIPEPMGFGDQRAEAHDWAILPGSSMGQGASGSAPIEVAEAPAAEEEPPAPRRRRARPATRRAARRAAVDEASADGSVQEIVYAPEEEPATSPRNESTLAAPAGLRFGRDELLPRSPSRAQVRVGLRRVASMLRNCSPDGPRQAPVTLTISGDTGQVTAVRLGGPLGGTPEGDCVERALRRAHFPRFAEPTHQLTSFPLVLR